RGASVEAGPPGLVGWADRPARAVRALGDGTAVVVADVELAVGGGVEEVLGRRVVAGDGDHAVRRAGRGVAVDTRVEAAEGQNRAVVGPVQLAVPGGGAQVDGDRLVAGPADDLVVRDVGRLNRGAGAEVVLVEEQRGGGVVSGAGAGPQDYEVGGREGGGHFTLFKGLDRQPRLVQRRGVRLPLPGATEEVLEERGDHGETSQVIRDRQHTGGWFPQPPHWSTRTSDKKLLGIGYHPPAAEASARAK